MIYIYIYRVKCYDILPLRRSWQRNQWSGLFTIQINMLFAKWNTHVAMPKLHTSRLENVILCKNRSICACIPSIRESESVTKRETGDCESYFHCQSLSLTVVLPAITPHDPRHILLWNLSEDNSYATPHLSVLSSGIQTKNSNLAATNRPKEELLRTYCSHWIDGWAYER